MEKVIVRRLSSKLYFGYEFREIEGERISVSDPEKTLIDLVYFNYPFLDDILEKMQPDKKKLESYIKRLKGVRGAKKIEKHLEGLF